MAYNGLRQAVWSKTAREANFNLAERVFSWADVMGSALTPRTGFWRPDLFWLTSSCQLPHAKSSLEVATLFHKSQFCLKSSLAICTSEKLHSSWCKSRRHSFAVAIEPGGCKQLGGTTTYNSAANHTMQCSRGRRWRYKVRRFMVQSQSGFLAWGDCRSMRILVVSLKMPHYQRIEPDLCLEFRFSACWPPLWYTERMTEQWWRRGMCITRLSMDTPIFNSATRECTMYVLFASFLGGFLNFEFPSLGCSTRCPSSSPPSAPCRFLG